MNQQQQSNKDKNLTLPLHLIGKKHSGPDVMMSHQSLSLRNEGGLNAQPSMKQQPATPDAS